MKKILDLITAEITQAFVDCGYDAKYGKVTLSNRPDLCEYQCTGAMAAWGETTEEDENSDEEEAELALMARSDSESEDEPMDSLAELKGKVRGLSKFKLEELLTTLMDEYDALNTENVMLKDTCSELKRDISVVEFANDILKKEKVEQGQHTENNDSENTIIHGDNLEALKALLPQYEGKVKCIYIVILTPILMSILSSEDAVRLNFIIHIMFLALFEMRNYNVLCGGAKWTI